MWEILLALALAVGGWLWMENQGVRDRAILIAKDFCKRQNVQFLDEAMSPVKWRLRRNTRGQMVIERTYRFEFSDTGDNRLKGTIIMLGKELDTMHLQPYRLTTELH